MEFSIFFEPFTYNRFIFEVDSLFLKKKFHVGR